MIVNNLVLILAIALPALVLVLLRTNAGIGFLSLCVGAVLVKFIGDDANLVGAAAGNNSPVVSQYTELVLLLLPLALTVFFLRKTVPQTKLIFNVIAAIAVGFAGVLLAVPLLPSGAQNALTSAQSWTLLQHNQELVIAAGALASLVVVWIIEPRGGRKRKH